MRLFVAVRLPVDVAAAASAVLPDIPALRRVDPELMHITLAFIGATEESRLDDVIGAARQAAATTAAFRVSLDVVGRFPERGLPHVAWLGVGQGAAELGAAAAALRRGLAASGVAFDEKPFRAHVALGRVRERADRDEARAIAAAIERAGPPSLSFTAHAVSVVESRLSPKGPRYTDRASVPFTVGGKA